MTEFARLLKYLRPYQIIFAISVVLMVATGLFEGGTLLLLQPIFDTISGHQSGGGVFAGLPFGKYLPKAGAIDLRAVVVLMVGVTVVNGVPAYFDAFSSRPVARTVI